MSDRSYKRWFVHDDRLSPTRQLNQHLEYLPLRLQSRLRGIVEGMSQVLEVTCSIVSTITQQGTSSYLARSFPERHALVAYAPETRPTVLLGLNKRPFSDLQKDGIEIVASISKHQVDPRRVLMGAIIEVLGSTQVDVARNELIDRCLVTTMALLPTGFEGRLPLAWIVAMGDGNLIAPIILPPTLNEIESGTWEQTP
jgi:hypothetical protein